MSAIYEAMGPGGHETYATSIFSKIKTYLDSNPYTPVKDVPNTPTAIASFNDGSDLPMPSLKVLIESYQEGSGDPSPTNIRPISGWDEVNVNVSGVNVWGGEKLADDIVAKVPDATKDTTNHTVAYAASNIDEKIIFRNFKENTQYSIFIDLVSGTSTNLGVVYKDGTKQVITGNIYPFITQANKSVDYIIGGWVTGSTTINYLTSGVFEGELTASDFEAYNGHTYTIDLDGTRYGGELDVVSGVLTVDRVSLTVDENSNIISGGYGFPFRIDLLTEAKASSSPSALTGVKCNFLKEVTQSSSWGVDGTFSRVTSVTKAVYFKVNSEITTVQQLKTFLQSNNLQFVYELATPQTIQLTPTQVKSLLGQNNVWADTGDVLYAEYIRDMYDNITAKYAAYAYNSGNASTASKLGSSNVGSATQPIYLNGGTATACTYTLGKSVPSDAVFTDTKVTQTATDGSSNAEYEVLFSGTADDTTRTEGTRKTSLFTFNPQTNEVAAGHFAAKSDSPSGIKTASLVGYDIQLGGTSNTWDGTNTSLKSSISSLNQSLTAMASDTGWQTVTSSYCNIKVRKIGKVVELNIWSDKAIPASQQIATLADTYKPVISVYPNRIYLRNSISTASDITLRIENNGTIYNTENANIAGHWVVIHAMWTSYPLPS